MDNRRKPGERYFSQAVNVKLAQERISITMVARATINFTNSIFFPQSQLKKRIITR
jgi:hypothetical protein